MTDTCGCCEGIEQVTTVTITNRPGLSALVYRVGTQATFFETMLARLSSLSVPSDADQTTPIYPLQALTTRSTGDPALALLDAWAIMGDVFTFYQERIANEGYLRTATHRHSILELARLVGYKPGPGVASSTYLAYTLQNGYDTLIPAGTRAQNIPAAGQLPQSFETSVDLQARAAWNNLQPRMSIPQYITQLGQSAVDTNVTDGAVYATGTATNLKPNDPVLFVFGNNDGEQVFAHVQGVTPHAAEKYTSVTFPAIFTPLVFLRNALTFVDRYLDLASFGVNASDLGVDEVTPLLELIKVLLMLGEQYLQQFAAGNVQTTTLTALGKALSLIGALLLWLERLLDLLISSGSSDAVDDALLALNSLLKEIESDTDKSVATLLQAVHAALQQFLQQMTQPDLLSLLQSAITLLQPFTDAGQYGADVSTLAQAVLNALQPFAQQTTSPTLITVLTATQNALQQYVTTAADSDAKKLANAMQEALIPLTSQGASPNLITAVMAVQQALSLQQTQISDQNVIALVQASLTMLDQMVQTIRGEIDTLLQAIDKALDNFLTGIANLFAADSTVVRVLNQSRAILRGAPQLLVRASAHIPALLRATAPTVEPLVRKALLKGNDITFPPNPLQDTLAVWCNVYQNAATNGQINVANWVGALLIDIKKLTAAVPGIGKLLGNVCTPAVISNLGSQVGPLSRPSNVQPTSSASLTRDVQTAFARSGDIAPQLLKAFQPQIASSLYTAYGNAQVTPPPPLQAFDALRVKATPFGSSAPKQASTMQSFDPNGNSTFTTTYSEWPIAESTVISVQVTPYDPTADTGVYLTFSFRQGPNVTSTTQFVGIPATQTIALPTNSAVINFTIKTTSSGSPAQISMTITSDSTPTLTLTPKQDVWNAQIAPSGYSVSMVYDTQDNLNISLVSFTSPTMLDLDARYDHIVPETWVVIEGASSLNLERPQRAIKIQNVETIARADYGISAKVTRLTLYEPWLTIDDLNRSPLDLSLYRGITVYAQSEKLPLADVPLTDDIAGQDIELDDLYNGLQSGRWVAVSGKRTDIPNTTGVQGSELMMLASVTQDVRRAAPTLQFSASASNIARNAEPATENQPPSVTLPGDTVHTTLHFATPLAYTYKRSSVVVNGNVVSATQGETQNQILGSGSGGTALQQFSLAKSPLTYIPAVTPTGEESTLQVFVNNVRWQEINSLETALATDRVYITQTDNQDKVTITFGNGVHGARLPTGNENVKAIYRTGIGTPGNVDVGKISQLVSKPLGVKAVNNPIAATGGADRESRDQARANVPLAATSLGRIVSVQDYADFARTFAGIGKASAAYLSDGQQQVVSLTIAGQGAIPIDPTSGLYQSLLQFLHTFGDPATPLMLALADVKLLVISARVSIQTDYLFDDVSAALRLALLAAFSFARRNLGQPVFQSEVLSVMQQVAGVAYVDLDILDAVSQQQLTNALQQIQAAELKAANTGQQDSNQPTLATLLGLKDRRVVPSALARLDSTQAGTILPAQLVFLSPDVQDTLILNQLTSLAFKPPSSKRRHAHSHRRQ